MPGGTGPGDAVVDVWVARLDPPPDVLEPLAAALAPGERERAARHRVPGGARRFCAARGWLRHVLGAVLGVAPADVALRDGPGKPCVPGGPHFNVSHAGEVVVVAVAAFEVGVDVEPTAGARRWADTVGLACAPGEAAALRRLPGEGGDGAFLALWTAKEAYLKAIGVGLAVAPGRVEVGVPSPRRHTAVAVDGTATGWWARQVWPAPGYVGAVAAEGRGWRPRLRTAELGLPQGVGVPA